MKSYRKHNFTRLKRKAKKKKLNRSPGKEEWKFKTFFVQDKAKEAIK